MKQNKELQNMMRWAIKKYVNSKTDLEIANGLRTTYDRVKKMRQRMGIKRIKDKNVV